jgi:hypothetical protein
MLLGQSMTLFGAVLITGGFWLWSPAAGCIVGGVFLSLGGAVVYRQSSGKG